MSKKNKTDYQITIGYKAVITVNVKADSEEEAKKSALAEFDKYRHFGPKSNIEDDIYAVHGVLNMTETWNAL